MESVCMTASVVLLANGGSGVGSDREGGDGHSACSEANVLVALASRSLLCLLSDLARL